MKVTTDACLFGAWCAEEVNKKTDTLSSSLLDIGTGTGLLSLMLAQKNDVPIVAIEIDKEAAVQAKENIAASPWKERIHIINSNVLDWESSEKYDCIISNPPFYENDLRSDVKSKNLAYHSEGLKLSDLIYFIKDHLSEYGLFFLLLPAKRENEIEQLIKQNRFRLIQKVSVKQSVTHNPFRIMLQAGWKQHGNSKTSEIVIKDKTDKYTPEFINLLKDYYLYL